MCLFSTSSSVEGIIMHTRKWSDISVLNTAVLKLTSKKLFALFQVTHVGLFMADIILFSYSKLKRLCILVVGNGLTWRTYL